MLADCQIRSNIAKHRETRIEFGQMMFDLFSIFVCTGGASRWSARQFEPQTKVFANVSSLFSPHSAIRLDYYLDDLFCTSSNTKPFSRTLGQSVTGEALSPPPFEFTIDDQSGCIQTCTKKYNASQLAKLIWLINKGYRVCLWFDRLPMTSFGFDIGYVRSAKHYVRNSLQFVVRLNREGGFRRVTSFDLASAISSTGVNCSQKQATAASIEEGQAISYEYSVAYETEPPPVTLGRMDRLMAASRNLLKPSLINSAVCIALSIVVVIFLLHRTAWKEQQRLGMDFDEYDGFEWKLIHGDVCRHPPDAAGLSARGGWGAHLLLAFICVLYLGWARRVALVSIGAVVDSFLLGIVLSAPIGGFVTGKFFKTIGDGNWRSLLVQSQKPMAAAFLGFSIIYSVVFWSNNSTTEWPIATLLSYCVLTIVLNLAGSVIGLRGQPFELSQKVNQLPRQIPPTSFVGRIVIPNALSAIFVYASAAANIHLLMVAGWTGTSHHFDFGGMLANLLALVCQAMVCGIVVTFWRLNKEDFRWWWSSYNSGASAAVLFALHSGYFIACWAPADWGSVLVFVYLTAVVGLVFRVIVGAMSFIGSFAFVRVIYNSLKIE
jgi:transmembrane 9 superfamily protein 2/4